MTFMHDSSHFHYRHCRYILLMILSFATVLFAQEGAKEAAAPPQNKGIPVLVMDIAATDETKSATFPGRVYAFRQSEIRARITGIVEKREFVEGSMVQAGELLFTIEDHSLAAIYRAREADVDQAEATYELSQQTIKRYRELLKMGAVSQQEYDQFLAQNKQAKAGLAQAKANRDLAKIDLDYAKVVAPIAGRIDQALVTEGALVTANTTQLATIEQIDKVYVDFTQSTNELNQLEAWMSNDTVDIAIVDINNQPIANKGELQFSSQRVDEATGSVRLRAIFDNPDNKLLPGMFVRVRVTQTSANEMIKVPQSAVYIGADSPFVYIIKDNQLTPQPVKLGEMADESFVIESGLEAGQQIVVQNVAAILDQPVMGLTAEQFAQMQSGQSAQSGQSEQSQSQTSAEKANQEQSAPEDAPKSTNQTESP